MHFFLYEIAARILAVYLLVDSVRTLRRAVAEGKVSYRSSNWFDFFFDWSDRIIDRNTSLFWYWLQFCAQIATAGACLFVLIFGWHVSART